MDGLIRNHSHKTSSNFNVCIVGAGGISSMHMLCLKGLPYVTVKAVVDPNIESAERLAKTWGIGLVYDNPYELLSSGICNVAHILVPPDKHQKVAQIYIDAGMHVLIEKPMCLTLGEAKMLKEAAQKSSVQVGVNHNAIFETAHIRAKEIIQSRVVGKIHHIYCYMNRDMTVNPTLWMFQSPQNIFFEQASHPLSQIYDLVGSLRECNLLTSKPIEIVPGQMFIDTWQASMICEKGNAQLFYSVAQDYNTMGMYIICEGGAVSMDLRNNRVTIEESPRGIYFTEYHLAKNIAKQLRRQSYRSLVDELKAKVNLKQTEFGMKRCIKKFYDELSKNNVTIGIEFGTEVVRMCERLTENLAEKENIESDRR